MPDQYRKILALLLCAALFMTTVMLDFGHHHEHGVAAITDVGRAADDAGEPQGHRLKLACTACLMMVTSVAVLESGDCISFEEEGLLPFDHGPSLTNSLTEVPYQLRAPPVTS